MMLSHLLTNHSRRFPFAFRQSLLQKLVKLLCRKNGKARLTGDDSSALSASSRMLITSEEQSFLPRLVFGQIFGNSLRSGINRIKTFVS